VTLLNGDTPKGTSTLYNTPSQLFVPAVVTKANIKAMIFDSGIQTAAEVCTAEYANACARLGITE
jgi:D-xylose transport system substrate-binding protein